MSNPAPITLEQLFRFYRGLPHQMAAVSELEADIKTAGYAVAMRRDRPWFKTWSTAGKQTEPGGPDAVSLALPLIKEFEGCKLTAYPDPGTGGDPWTIGWGSTTYLNGKRVMPGDTITQAQADELLTVRVRRDERQLAKTVPTWAGLKAHQQAALLSFTYNVGPNWYGGQGFRTISQKVGDGLVDEVPEALLLYVNPGTSVTAGLTRRREAEGELWEGKTLAGLGLAPQQPVRLPNHMTLMRTGEVDGRGLELLKLEFVVNSIPMAHLLVVSGAPGRQNFRKGRDSRVQSMEPLPEGRWGVEDIEWKGGKDVYEGSWGPGLGPVWVGLNYQAPGKTERSAIGIHLDENQGSNPGTAGCVGVRSVADLKRLVALLRKHDPHLLFVNWGLGSCPPVRPV